MSQVAHLFKDKQRTGDVTISEDVDFNGLLLSDPVTKGLKNSGFERPSPIQLKAIPLGRCGLDLIVQAKSGTGKTCVFTVIALESLQLDSYSIQVLVLAPTREIAIQIWDVIRSIGSTLPALQCHTFIGGLPVQEDKIKLKKCHIAVGTPGRIKQLIEFGALSTASIRLFVLDEADKLLEENFQQQINWIYSMLPENKQMLALSATYPEYLAQHLTAYMRNPTFIRLNITDPTLLGIRQFYTSVPYHPMSQVMFESKTKVLLNIFSSISFQQCLVFSNLQTRAQSLADSLNAKGWPTACIAGSLEQKERNEAMAKLKTYKCRILISTDLTSRGIDADKVDLVINMDVPKDHETYLHRIGRAGRFGSYGAGITVVSEGQEMLDLQSVEKKCNTHINELPDPLPTDLLKTEVKFCLDDVVSAEVIHTIGNKDDHTKPMTSDEFTAQYSGTFATNKLPSKFESDVKESLKNRSSTCLEQKENGPDETRQSGEYHLQDAVNGNVDILEKEIHIEEYKDYHELGCLGDQAITVQKEFTQRLNMANDSESFHITISSSVNLEASVQTEPAKLIKHTTQAQSDSCDSGQVKYDVDRLSSHQSDRHSVESFWTVSSVKKCVDDEPVKKDFTSCSEAVISVINLDDRGKRSSVKAAESFPVKKNEMIVESSTVGDNLNSHSLNKSNALTAGVESDTTESQVINNRNRGIKDIQDSLVLSNIPETFVKRTKLLKNPTKSHMTLRQKNESSAEIKDSPAVIYQGIEKAKKNDEQESKPSFIPNKKVSSKNGCLSLPDVPQNWSTPEFSTSIGYKRLAKISTYSSAKEDLEKFLKEQNGKNDNNEFMINKKLRIPREVPVNEEDRQIIRTIIDSFNNLKFDQDRHGLLLSNLDMREGVSHQLSENLASKGESEEYRLSGKDSESIHAPITTNTGRNCVMHSVSGLSQILESLSVDIKEEMHTDGGNKTNCISRNMANESNPDDSVGGVQTSSWKYPFLKTGAIPKRHLQKLAVGNLAIWEMEEDNIGDTAMNAIDGCLIRKTDTSKVIEVSGADQYTEDSDSDSLSESETNSRESTETSTKESETSSDEETNSSKTKQSLKNNCVEKAVNQKSAKLNLHTQKFCDQVRSEKYIQNRRGKLNRLDSEEEVVEEENFSGETHQRQTEEMFRKEYLSHSSDSKSTIRNQSKNLPQNNCIPSSMPADEDTLKMYNQPYNWYQHPYYQYCYKYGYPMWQHQVPFHQNPWYFSTYASQPYSQTWYRHGSFYQGQRSQSCMQDNYKRMEEIYKAQWNYIKMMSKR
ncbi:hypothetical protein CHS0354_004938 [Potamilus streckersoni]|uniref:RNA helicase n=1 Tax=Potamilus streckersoni TaxID=2493646 RepID=A0AAE0RN80_9BIVA|nr:hypothetical protein CHS0354_004938 [Potamilus streckersoni]